MRGVVIGSLLTLIVGSLAVTVIQTNEDESFCLSVEGQWFDWYERECFTEDGRRVRIP